MDVTVEGSVEAAFGEIDASGYQLDVVINNAGIGGRGYAMDQPIEVFDQIIATNLRSVWLVSTAAARRWRAAGRGGSIVNIASIQGERVSSHASAYSASKAGVVHLTRNLALDWARHGIRVNAIEPGYIATEMTEVSLETPAGQAMIKRIPMQRLGRPDELDGALLLLSTDAGSWMTGSVIAVDGGHLVSSL